MRKLIPLLIMISLCFVTTVNAAEQMFVFRADLNRNHTVQLIDFSLTDGKLREFSQTPSDYHLKMFSDTNILILDVPLQISFTAYPETNFTIDTIELNQTSIYLRLPYHENAAKIRLFYQNEMLYSLDIKSHLCISDGECNPFCTWQEDADCVRPSECGNTVCEHDETYTSCPADCQKPPDDKCDGLANGVCGPGCLASEDPDCVQEISFTPYMIVFVILIIIVIAYFIFKQSKPKEQANV